MHEAPCIIPWRSVTTDSLSFRRANALGVFILCSRSSALAKAWLFILPTLCS